MTIHQVTTEICLLFFEQNFSWNEVLHICCYIFKRTSKVLTCYISLSFLENVAIDDFASNTRLLPKILHFWNWLLIIKKSGGVIFLAFVFGIFHQRVKKNLCLRFAVSKMMWWRFVFLVLFLLFFLRSKILFKALCIRSHNNFFCLLDPL